MVAYKNRHWQLTMRHHEMPIVYCGSAAALLKGVKGTLPARVAPIGAPSPPVPAREKRLPTSGQPRALATSASRTHAFVV